MPGTVSPAPRRHNAHLHQSDASNGLWTGTARGPQRTSNDRIDLHRNDPTPHDFGRLYIDLASAAQPDLTIVDFSIGMEGNGPTAGAGGTSVDMRSRLGSWLLLASTDAVAADATAARVMSHEAIYVERILPMARQAGLGAMCPQSIELIGAQLEDLRVPWRAAQVG